MNSKQELETAYEELQSTNEELETTNEELQSTVEELETTNEELQSTNEELETMNEELQSSNEELQTMNDELRSRGIELEQLEQFPRVGAGEPAVRRSRRRIATCACRRGTRNRSTCGGCVPKKRSAITSSVSTSACRPSRCTPRSKTFCTGVRRTRTWSCRRQTAGAGP